MVRPAKEEDIPRVNELREQVNELHVKGRPDIFCPGFGREMQELAYEMLKREDQEIFVAERGGVICGMACVAYIERPQSSYCYERRYCHIEEFEVDEAFRRQGVGTELFDFIKKEAKRKGFPKIELDVWEFNESAMKFYEAVGFSIYRRFLECEVE